MAKSKNVFTVALLFNCYLLFMLFTGANATNEQTQTDNGQQELQQTQSTNTESPTLTAVIQMLDESKLSSNPPKPNVPAAELQIQQVHQTKNPKHITSFIPIQPQSSLKSHFIERFKLTPEQQKERTGKILLSLQTAIRRARRDPKGQQKVSALEKAFSKAILRVQNIRRSRRRRHRSRSSSRSANSTSVRHRTRTRRSRSKSRSSSTNSSSSSSSSSNSNSFNLSWSSSTTDSTSTTSSSSTTIIRRRHRHKKRSSSTSSSSTDERIFKRYHHHSAKKNNHSSSLADPRRHSNRQHHKDKKKKKHVTGKKGKKSGRRKNRHGFNNAASSSSS